MIESPSRQPGWALLHGSSLQIQIGDGELEDSGKRYPCEIWDVGVCYPFVVRVDSDESPHESAENKEDIDRCEKIILKTELNRRVGEIEHEVEGKGDRYVRAQFPSERFIEYEAERDGHDDVEHCPYRCEKPCRRRPCGLEERGVLRHGVHAPNNRTFFLIPSFFSPFFLFCFPILVFCKTLA